MTNYRRGQRGFAREVESFCVEESAGFKVSEYLAFGSAGLALALTVAVTGHYFGQQANARTSLPPAELAEYTSPASTIVRKGSLLNEPVDDSFKIELASLQPAVASSGKGDLAMSQEIIEPQEKLARLDQLIVTPPVRQLERNWKMGSQRKQRIIAERKKRMAGASCLARAIYFEARSESELGQLAVAKVIMNRVKDRNYPNSICDVVYQGSHRKNSCQFSFACDGSPDVPKNAKSWSQAKRVASRALNGASDVQVISTATHYHADYVNPRWSSAMKRLIKIGKHIFYHDS